MTNVYQFESGDKGKEILQRLGYDVVDWCVVPSEVSEDYPRHKGPDKNPISMAYLSDDGRLELSAFRELKKRQGELETSLNKLEIPSSGAFIPSGEDNSPDGFRE